MPRLFRAPLVLLILGALMLGACSESQGSPQPAETQAQQDAAPTEFAPTPGTSPSGVTSSGPQEPTPTEEATPISQGGTTPAIVTPEGEVIWNRPSTATQGGPSVTVKFTDGLVVRLAPGGLVNLGAPSDLADAAAAIARHPVVDVTPVFNRPVSELEAERQRARQQSGTLPPDLTLFYILHLAPGASPQALIADLSTVDSVESAYMTPAGAPPPGPGR